MALSPKEQERIIAEETLRFKTRQDLHAQACAHRPRRGRWVWAVAILGLAWLLWHHGRCCDRALACHGMGMGMMGGAACMHHGMMGGPGMMPYGDEAPTDEVPAAKGPAQAPAKAPAKK